MLGLTSGDIFSAEFCAKLLFGKIDQGESEPLASQADRIMHSIEMSKSEVIFWHLNIELDELSSSKMIFQTQDRYLGIAPEGALPGDQVCSLLSSDRPVILRRAGDRYVQVGACFNLGFMDGESWEDVRGGKRELVRFEI